MNTQTNETRYLPMLVVGIAVILVSTAAIARIIGWIPASAGGFGNIFAIAAFPVASAEAVPEAVDLDLAQAPGGAPGRQRCPECSVIVSMREIDANGPNAGLDALRKKVAGNENGTRATLARSCEFTVRLGSGSRRLIIDENRARWRAGERVIVIDGANPSNK